MKLETIEQRNKRLQSYRDYHSRNRLKINESSLKHYYKNFDYYKKKSSDYYKKNKNTIREKSYNKLQIDRLKVIKYYSNGLMSCACCGDDHLEFLTLDHIDDDGGKHRKTLTDNIYKWLIKNGFPNLPRIQILCWNCNMVKRFKKDCPHRRKKVVKG